MIGLGFHKKSKNPPEIILNKIPKDLHRYFFLGFFDGDGCLYHNKGRNCFTLSFTGPKEQDWRFVEELLKSLQIKYGIIRRSHVSKEGTTQSNSFISIQNWSGIKKALEFLYNGTDLGLSRKRAIYEKFLLLEKSSSRRKTNT